MVKRRGINRAVYEFRNATAPPGTKRIDSPKALAAVAHPLRSRLLTQLGEPRSIKELADLVDAPPARLYHHVQRLVDEGIIGAVSGRQVGSNTERLYQVVARRIEIAGPDVPGMPVDGTADAFESAGEVSVDLARAAADDELAVVARWVVNLRADEALALARRLVKVVDGAEDDAEPGGDAHLVQIVVSRTERRSGSRLVAATAEDFEKSPPRGPARKRAVSKTVKITKKRGSR